MNSQAGTAIAPSLANYLQFLRFFRGTVTEQADRIVVASDRPEFTMLIPLEPEAWPLVEAFDGAVLALPGLSWLDETLAQTSRQRRAEIVCMSKAVASGEAPAPAADIQVARTASDVDTFSLLQSRGFIEDPQEFEVWFPWLAASNRRNVENERCHFLVADCAGTPAAVTLIVESDAVCGIYAVATIPEYRRRGLSTRLLAAAEAIARRGGYEQVSLQVYAGTDAHAFYGHRGFVEDFRICVWRR